eukprot:m.78788 g.78788  ORF g.78788 m.78788 type:complete len:59 (-) comp10744_c0_seq1:93-269(-)
MENGNEHPSPVRNHFYGRSRVSRLNHSKPMTLVAKLFATHWTCRCATGQLASVKLTQT